MVKSVLSLNFEIEYRKSSQFSQLGGSGCAVESTVSGNAH